MLIMYFFEGFNVVSLPRVHVLYSCTFRTGIAQSFATGLPLFHSSRLMKLYSSRAEK